MRLLATLAGVALAMVGPAAAAQTVDAPVLVRPVEKGALLSASDFEVQPLRPASAHGAVAPADAAGKEASRPLRAGSIVRAGDLIRPQLVRRGEPVLLSVTVGALSITAPGRALSSGASGDLVRVVSTSTSRTIDGVVEANGRVRVMAN